MDDNAAVVESSVSVIERTLYKLMLDFTEHVQVLLLLNVTSYLTNTGNSWVFANVDVDIAHILVSAIWYNWVILKAVVQHIVRSSEKNLL